MADWTPQSRAEEILFNTINGEPYDGLPQSRIEELLLELKDAIESGGGGGGGTDNYNLLKNLPQINGQTVKGNMSGTTLGLVNMVMGKDLSTNDYTNADKAIVDSVTANLADKVDKIAGKGLSENDYTDADKAIVDGVTSALAGKVSTSSVGSANGVAELDANGRVPSSQLPSYVDDTVEGYLNSVDGKFYADSSYTTEIAGETGKIYVTLDTNKTHRWSGSGFVEISESLALGETSSTAYAGNKGKANADAIAAMKDGTNIDSFGDAESAISAVDGKIAFPTISSGNPADIKGLNAQVSKSSNYSIITLLTSSPSSDADKLTIEWDGNNDVVRFRNYINNTKVKEATYMSSDKKQTIVNLDPTYDADTDWNIVKQGNICVMNMRTLKDIPVGNTVIGNIPVGFRPESDFIEFVYSFNKNINIGVNIYTSGDVQILNPTGATLQDTVHFNRNVTYFTA